MEDTLFNELINSVEEAGQIVRGEKPPSRIYSDVFVDAQKNPEYEQFLKESRTQINIERLEYLTKLYHGLIENSEITKEELNELNELNKTQ